MGAAGAASDPTYVDDVFSTALYTGNASSNTVPSGLDFTEGSWLSWIKLRDGSDSHFLSDSTQKTGVCFDSLASDRTYGKQTGETTGINAVGTSSYSIQGSNAQVNGNTKKYASWNFKAAPGFLDIVTWTGNSTAGRQIPHALGSVPGMIMIKRTSSAEDWIVGHRSIGLGTGRLVLNDNTGNSNGSATTYWNNTAATSSQFTVGSHVAVNGNGDTYVAYIFAHDDASFGTDGDESIIKCGSYAGNVTGADLRVDVGFEPQFVLIKSSSTSSDWHILDVIRGAADAGSDQALLAANRSVDEPSSGIRLFVTNEGFGTNQQTGTNINEAGQTYIYMAIRRPNKPPESATEVFAMDINTTNDPEYVSNFVVDMGLWTAPTLSANRYIASRLTDRQALKTNSNASTTEFSNKLFDFMNGFGNDTSNDSNYQAYMFKRASGFMDVVPYSGTVTGNSGSQTVSHNLGVTPELMLVKRRSGGADWYVYSNALTNPPAKRLELNSTNGESDSANAWGPTSSPTAPNANNFTVGYSTNTGWVTAGTFIAYLFATLPGISKVGSYTGNGGTQNIDCGFTNGARFILIKRTDAAADWYVFDTIRGIGSGNDPSFKLNVTTAQNANENIINPLAAGFTLNTAYTAFNGSGGNYLFLAIA